MQFTERKTESGYTYKVEDIFGSVTINVNRKMIGTELDAVVLQALRSGSENGIISVNGTQLGEYIFEKNPDWLSDESGAEGKLNI